MDDSKSHFSGEFFLCGAHDFGFEREREDERRMETRVVLLRNKNVEEVNFLYLSTYIV